ncbi:TIGR03013 family XrtA/PEP-CTERM system glycosyltransferase [Thalassotalea aquiviva]|uniref:TIGR03013 family XrtA/PEP-CTERM system glycosyltransferase n=1 Tax=Thalassotalea aquiviva TaxID=3242415 RepID=UPI00352B70AE
MKSHFYNRYHSSVKLLVLLDIIIIFVITLVFHWQIILENSANYKNYGQIATFIMCFQLILLSLGLYQVKLRESYSGMFRRIFLATLCTFVVFSLVNFLIFETIFNNRSIVLTLLFSGILCFGYRGIFVKYDVFNIYKRTVVILGTGQRAEIIEKRMRRKVDQHGFTILGFIAMKGDKEGCISTDKIISYPDDFIEFIQQNNVNEIVVANDERRDNLPIEDLFYCRLKGVQISEILDFIENETGQLAVNLMYPSWIIYSNGFTYNNDFKNALDWLFNAVLATIIFILTWPLMLLTIIAIKIEDGITQPCFYVQNRVGQNGRVFQIIKFRSMIQGAEKNGAQWAKTGDSRVTKVGGFIRKYRIDELPQLFNVLSGDMGFVGPRPERPEFVNQFNAKIPYYNERHKVKSGLTGWAQLKYPYGASMEDAQEKLKYDLYYIKHRSFILDILILLQTAEIVLFGKGR